MAAENILIVDDDKNMLEVLSLRLEAEGYKVTATAGAEDALGMVKDGLFDLALVDLKLAGKDGIELMQGLRRITPEMPVIILTAYGTIVTAVEAMKQGAYSYLTKPFDHRELLLQIKNGIERTRLSREVKRLKGLVEERYEFKNIIGKNEKMKAVLEQVAMAAETDSNVFIQGESGTGKELIAKALHLASPRKDGPFLAINSVRLSLKPYWKASCSVLARARSPGLSPAKKGFSPRPTGAPYFWMRSVRRPCLCRRSCCGCWKRGNFTPWDQKILSKWT